ncbi:hypothetical protein OHA61_06820 [Streptomyces sp. NBC_00885]|nr:hypothetical protein OHA61_06820 [Streptomyces sp. NBC_00885]
MDAALELAWHGPRRAGDWTPITRTFRDGHTVTWWAADATLGIWGPDGLTRPVVAGLTRPWSTAGAPHAVET